MPKYIYASQDPNWTEEKVNTAQHYNGERFTDKQMDPEFSVQYNGPTTSLISRGDLFAMSLDLTRGGKRPDVAARDLARYTRNNDGNNFGFTLDHDPVFYSQTPNSAKGSEKLMYENIVKNTLKRSVLETANAILWVLMQVDWDKHGNTDDYDTVGRLIDDFEPVETEAVRHNPVPAADIPNTMQGWTSFEHSVAGMTLSANTVSMLVVLAPLIAIVLIPVTEKVLEKVLTH